MRARLILEHGGHSITKRVELPEAPAVGSIVLAERERSVVSVEPNPGRSELDAYLREDGDDIKMQVSPGGSRSDKKSCNALILQRSLRDFPGGLGRQRRGLELGA